MSATIEENKMNTSNKITTLKLVLEQTDGIAKDKLFGLGLGAQRCGSTWIGKYLSNHPEFYISSIKEMHIFDALRKQRKHPLLRKFNENEAFQLQPDQQDILKIYEGKKKYYEYFDEKIESSHTAFGEITPEYSLLGKQFLKIIEEATDAFFTDTSPLRKMSGIGRNYLQPPPQGNASATRDQKSG